MERLRFPIANAVEHEFYLSVKKPLLAGLEKQGEASIE